MLRPDAIPLKAALSPKAIPIPRPVRAFASSRSPSKLKRASAKVHALRRTSATLLSQNETDLDTSGGLLRQSRFGTTAVYLHALEACLKNGVETYPLERAACASSSQRDGALSDARVSRPGLWWKPNEYSCPARKRGSSGCTYAIRWAQQTTEPRPLKSCDRPVGIPRAVTMPGLPCHIAPVHTE